MCGSLSFCCVWSVCLPRNGSVKLSRSRFIREMKIQVKVNGPRGEEKVVDVCNSEEQMKSITVLHLKKKITHELSIGNDIRLVFRTEGLQDSVLLLSYGIKHMSTIHTLLMLPGGAR